MIGIFFVNTPQKILHASAGFLLFTSYLFTLTSNGRIFWEVIGKKEEVRSEVAFRFGEKHFYYNTRLFPLGSCKPPKTVL